MARPGIRIKVHSKDNGKKRMCGSADVATGRELWLEIGLRLKLKLGLGISLGDV